MTVGIKRWFLGLIVLIVATAIISYLLMVLGLGWGHRPGQVGNWLLLAAVLATSIGIAHVIWDRLNRSATAVREELRRIRSDSEAKISSKKSRVIRRCIEPELDRSITAIRNKFRALRREREKLEKEKELIERHRQELEIILQSIPEAVIVTNETEKVVLTNSAAEELFGFKHNAKNPLSLGEYIPDEGLVRVLQDKQKSPGNMVVEYSAPDGRDKRWYNVAVSALASADDDQTGGVLTIFHDVTQDKETVRMKTEFVSNVSHELRTPLASIKAHMEMLLDGEIEDAHTRQNFYQVVGKETDRLSRLVDNLLNIARIEAGVVKPSKEGLGLQEVIKEVIQVLGPQAESSKIELELELPDEPCRVRIDKEMIRMAMQNLISNALKYTPEGGRVTVRMVADDESGQVRVDISDTGVGISEKNLARIFEKFYRVPSSRKMGTGTGLGLPLAKEIVETVHAGRLEVSSVVGKGSRFSVVLPVAEAAKSLVAVG